MISILLFTCGLCMRWCLAWIISTHVTYCKIFYYACASLWCQQQAYNFADFRLPSLTLFCTSYISYCMAHWGEQEHTELQPLPLSITGSAVSILLYLFCFLNAALWFQIRITCQWLFCYFQFQMLYYVVNCTYKFTPLAISMQRLLQSIPEVLD